HHCLPIWDRKSGTDTELPSFQKFGGCPQNSVAFRAGGALTRCRRCDGALEIGLRTRITMDRHMLRNIQLQPLDIVVERYRVRADILDRRAGRGWSHVRV